jgi:hypothetical protein
MLLRLRSIAVVFVAAVSFQASASADLIFDNTIASANTDVVTNPFPQFGGEVTAAAGTSRVVTELDISFNTQGNSVVFADLQAILYANDGPVGLPGTLLWQSSVMSHVLINGDNTLIAFSVPSVIVPDTFTWTSAITNASRPMGWAPGSGATTGVFDRVVEGMPGSWGFIEPDFETQARVFASAVPEPASCSLLIVGAAGAALSRRCRRLARKDG